MNAMDCRRKPLRAISDWRLSMLAGLTKNRDLLAGGPSLRRGWDGDLGLMPSAPKVRKKIKKKKLSKKAMM